MPIAPLFEDVRARLSRVIGAAKAQTIIQETLKKAGIQEIVTPQDMFAFATLLEAHGGSVAVVAAALKMRAVLRGATPG
jgi:GTP cyclohydrolase I